MRQMKNANGQVLNVVEHIILRNMWEYYVTEEDTGDDKIKFCLVLGHENEMGDVYMPEIEPFIISKTRRLNGVLPALGWEWV